MLKNNPLVSVAVITYNQKGFLKECVDSILNQDYENLEIIIADDCSTDGTTEIAREYQKSYPHKIRLALAEKNGGITKNCNSALQMCTGELVCLTGGDDIFLPGKITKQVQWFLKTPDGALCTSDIEVFISETNQASHIFRSKEHRQGGPIKAIIRQRNQPPSSNFMFNRTICPNLLFDERTPVVSDWLFFIEVSLLGKIGYLEETLFRYRRHGNNATTGGSGKLYIEDRLIYTDILLSRHPEYYRSCKIQRANIFFEAGKMEFFLKEFRSARKKSVIGISEYPFDFRNWGLLFSSFFGKYAFKIANYFKGY